MREQQVRDAVQRDDRLARPRAALHDERLLGRGAHDRVLLGLEGRDRGAHAAGTPLGQGCQQRALADEAVLVVRPGRRAVERLVVHAGDAVARGPHVPAPREALRLARGRGVEGAGAVGAPVEHERVGVVVGRGDPDPPDVARHALDGVDAAEHEPALRPLELGAPTVQPRAPRALDDVLGAGPVRVDRHGELGVQLGEEPGAARERGVEVLLLLRDGVRGGIAVVAVVAVGGGRRGRGGLERHGTSSRTTYGHGPNAPSRPIVPGGRALSPGSARRGQARGSPRTRPPTPRRR